MPNRSSNNSIRITITVNKQVRSYLERLVSIGLYGNSVAEAATQLVCEGLRSDLKQRRVKLVENSAPADETKSE